MDYVSEDLERLARGQLVSPTAFLGILSDSDAVERLARTKVLFSDEPSDCEKHEDEFEGIEEMPVDFEQLARYAENPHEESEADCFLREHFPEARERICDNVGLVVSAEASEAWSWASFSNVMVQRVSQITNTISDTINGKRIGAWECCVPEAAVDLHCGIPDPVAVKLKIDEVAEVKLTITPIYRAAFHGVRWLLEFELEKDSCVDLLIGISNTTDAIPATRRLTASQPVTYEKTPPIDSGFEDLIKQTLADAISSEPVSCMGSRAL